MSRRPLRRNLLPLLIGGWVLIVPWLWLVWNGTAGQIPALHLAAAKPLNGAVAPPPVAPSPATLTDGRWQAATGRALGPDIPLWRLLVRSRNRFYYDVLGQSPAASVVIGRNRALYERFYLDERCARGMKPWRAAFAARLPLLRSLQDHYARAGKVFVYVLTPSKPMHHPEDIPDDYPCFGDPVRRDAVLPAWRAMLADAGVRAVDGVALVAAARPANPLPLFPLQGTHWTMQGAGMAARALTATTNAAAGRAVLTPLAFTWRPSESPRGTDRDLYNLLNLHGGKPRYPVPDVRFLPQGRPGPPPPGCRPARVAIVGGSFVGQLADALESVACPPQIAFWFYWDMKQIRWQGGPEGKRELAIDPAARARDLATADVVILEQNESLLTDDRLLRNLHALVTGGGTP